MNRITKDMYHGHKNLKAAFQPNIGLDTSVRQYVVDILNLILADERVLSYKTHKAGCNQSDTNVPVLQSLYNTQYKQLNVISREIEERIQIMGGMYLSDFAEFLECTRLGADLSIYPGPLNILADHEAFIRFLREDAQKCSELYEDQGTFALLIDILRSHEKMAWILRKNMNMEQFD